MASFLHAHSPIQGDCVGITKYPQTRGRRAALFSCQVDTNVALMPKVVKGAQDDSLQSKNQRVDIFDSGNSDAQRRCRMNRRQQVTTLRRDLNTLTARVGDPALTRPQSEEILTALEQATRQVLASSGIEVREARPVKTTPRGEPQPQ